MLSSNFKKGINPESFQEVSDFWSFELNNEIYLKDHPGVVRGSKEYFDIILSARRKFIYYFPIMLSYLENSPSKHFLEVGSGMGTDSIVFARKGFNVTGVDLAPAHVELSKRLFDLYQEIGSFSVGNAENLDFPDNTFGSVFSFGALHHSPNPGRCIEEIYRVLAPCGRAVIMLYHKHSLNNIAHFLFKKGFENYNSKLDAPITYRFSKKQVEKMFSNFSKCHIRTEYLYGAGWGKIYDITPRVVYRILSKVMGWHLVIYLDK